ncbi:MAG: hypothetical protein AAF823_00055 [Planctomycetota bacterium]
MLTSRLANTRRTSLALAVATLPLATAGCGSEQAQADRAMESAIVQVNIAERGYAEESGGSVSEFRQEQLAVALTDLTAAAQGEGNGSSAAAQLAAHIHTSAANDAVSAARLAYAKLAPEVAGLVWLASTAATADAGASRAGVDRDPALAVLQERLNEVNAQRDAERRNVSQLSAEADTLKSKAQAARAASTAKLAEARDFASRAFNATGDAVYALEAQAAEAEIAGLRESVRADAVDTDLTIVNVRLASARARLDQAEGSIDRLKSRIEGQRALSDTEADSAQAARDDRQAAIAKLTEAFDSVTAAYAADVDALFVEAIDHADDAVGSARRGESLAQGPARQNAQLGVISAQITQGFAAAQRALTAAMFADVLESAATTVRPFDAATAAAFAENATGVRETGSESAESAKSALEEALAGANRLNNEQSTTLNLQASAISDALSEAGY